MGNGGISNGSTPQLNDQKFSKNAKAVLLLSVIAFMVDSIDAGIYGQTMPWIRDEFGVDSTQLGIVASFFFAGTVVGGFILPYLAEKKGRRLGMVIAIAMYSLFTCFIGFTDTVLSVAVLRFLTGCGTGALWAICSTYIIDVVPSHKRAFSLSIMQAGYAVGLFAMSGLVTGIIGAGGNWRNVYQVLILSVILIPFIMLKLKESDVWVERNALAKSTTEAGGKKEKVNYVEIFKPGMLKSTVISTILHCCLAIFGWAVVVWMPSALRNDFGMETIEASQFMMFVYGVAAVGYITAGFFCDKIGRKPTLIIYMALGLIGMIALYNMMSMESVPYPLFVLVTGLVGWSFGVYVIIITYTNELFPSHIRSLGVSFGINIGRALTIITPIVMGVIADNYTVTFAMLVVSLIGGIMIPTVLFGPETAQKKLKTK